MATHVDRVNETTIRVVVYGVLGFRVLRNYYNCLHGFRRGRDGSLQELTEDDYLQFD